MKSAKDILTPEEYEKYQQEWRDFKGKYTKNSPYNVNSNTPFISLVYQFQDKPLFRAKVFNRELRKFTPYFNAGEHLLPFWDGTHQLLVGVQMYTASSHLVRDNYDTTEALEARTSLDFKARIYWNDRISVELIIEQRNLISSIYGTFYSDKTKKLLAQGISLIVLHSRAYYECIERIKKGKKGEIPDLIRKIQMQEIHLGKLNVPRTNLPSSEDLISRLEQGEIPEAELHNFFSLWDK